MGVRGVGGVAMTTAGLERTGFCAGAVVVACFVVALRPRVAGADFAAAGAAEDFEERGAGLGALGSGASLEREQA